MTCATAAAAALALGLAVGDAQAEERDLGQREYRILAGPIDESEAIATAGVTLNKAFDDLYLVGISPHLPPKVDGVTQVVWQVWWTFNTSLWPHELGHWARARQAGGAFVIEGYGFPFPIASMDLPDDLEPAEDVLTSTGGFEINMLMLDEERTDFFAEGIGHSDVLIHGFIQEIYFPMYAWLIARAKPDEPDTWTDTYGDPVEGTLIIFKNHTGREPLQADGTVDPDLAALYRQAVWVNAASVVLDPMLYQQARAFAVDMRHDHGAMEPWMLGGDRFAWMYGTRFLLTPLGWQVTMDNYLRVPGRLGVVSLSTSQPFQSFGLGLRLPDLVVAGPLRLDLEADAWQQEQWGLGASGTITASVRVVDGLSLLVRGGWKDEGYLVGREVEAGPWLLGGLGYAWRP